MATRRPKVPRVTPPAQQSAAREAGGDVIQADFGGPRPAHTTHETGHGPKEGRAGGGPKAGPRTPGSTGTAGAGSPTSAAAKAGAGRTGSSAAGKTATGRTKSGKAEADNLDPVPAKAFSGRMLALAVVMVAITIMLAPTVKIFIDKRAEIAALQSDIADSKANQDNLKRQVSRWQDPNYVKQQARDRINMVMPGETGYWVFGSDLPAGAAGSQPSAAERQDPAEVPWVDSLWESIRRSATD
ncbi:septum formation initiator family protein [Arthrobacter sp. NPDC057388]|uniref:FtsB family cell division protein n=1 Tax=Arthrobacter sp. NPDC057388 TaxID=3346116 RepID=UPI00362D1F14